MARLRHAAVAALLAFGSARAAAGETVRGRLAATDPAANRLTVKTGDRAIDLAGTPQSRPEVGGKAVPLADLKPGQRARATCRAVGGANQVVTPARR